MQIPSRESRGERNDVGCGGNAALSNYAYVYETMVSRGEPSRLGTRTYFEVGFTLQTMLEFCLFSIKLSSFAAKSKDHACFFYSASYVSKTR